MPVQLEDLQSSIARVFEAQVDLRGPAPAICTASRVWSYEQVEAAANRVANQLLSGSASEPIPLAITDPALMLVSVLGVLKAGKFYVPVNPYFPKLRVGMMLEDLLPSVVLYDKTGFEMCGRDAHYPRLLIEDVLSGSASETRPAIPANPDRFAYVLYTSGSTGRPKGFAQTERNVLHNIFRHNALDIVPEDRVTVISSDGFVGAVSNPVSGLLNGACLYPYSFRHDGVHGLAEWLAQNRITFYYSFPSFFRQFVAAVPKPPQDCHLRLLYLGGEPVFSSDVVSARKLFPATTVAIGLNSTETGLTALNLISPDQEEPKQTVPLGKAVPGVTIAILDEGGRPVYNQAGEIATVSEYIVPRHWNQGGATEDATTPGFTEGARLFRTGDRGLLNPQGELIHMGRMDSMIKVRGYRVELTEVESALSRVAGVAEAVVVPFQRTAEEIELVAYVVVRDPQLDGNALRRLLGDMLPEAMLPSVFVLMDTLPRTENGKVNRRMLPSPPAVRASSASQYVEPSNPIEEQVAKIWTKVLSVMTIGANDNFFNLGGHSLTAVRVISMIRKEFGVPLPLKVIFDTPTVAAVAQEIARMKNGNLAESAPSMHAKTGAGTGLLG